MYLSYFLNKLKKAIRVISFAKKYDHTEPLFKKHKILPFRDQITYKKAVYVWKVANGYAPDVTAKIFVKNDQNQKKFVLPHPPNDKAKNYFVYSCVLAWNTVPDVLKNVTIFSAFTRNLKGYLLGDPIENNIFVNENARINNNTNT